MAATPYDALINEAATANGVPPEVMHALVKTESNYDPKAVSKAGAIGLAQLMPGTAKELGVDPTDPAQNVHGGARYLKQQYDRFGNWPQALAAYNAGPDRVAAGGRLPGETQDYVPRVMGRAGMPVEAAPYTPPPPRTGASVTGGPATGVKAPEVPIFSMKTGERVSIAPQSVPEAIQSGQYGFLKGSQIPVLDPDTGKITSVTAEDAAKAFQQGFVFADETALYKSALQAKHGTGLEQAKTFAESALGTATFGVSPWLERATGLSTPEAMAARQEANPGTAMIGDVAGIAGSMLIPGPNLVKGVGLLGEAGARGVAEALPFGERAIAAAPGIVAKAAEAAPPAGLIERITKLAAGLPGRLEAAGTRALQSVQDVPELAKTIVAKGLARGAQGAVEGALYAGGHELNRAALDDPNITAESVLWNIGTMSALGGGIGALLGPVGPKIGRTPLPVEAGTPKTFGSLNQIFNMKAGVAAMASGSPLGLPLGLWWAKDALPDVLSVAEHFGSFVNQTRNQLVKGASAVVRASGAAAGVPIAVAEEQKVEKVRETFQKRIETLQRLAGDPELLQRQLAAQTDPLHGPLPGVAQGMQLTSSRAVSFLASKVPQQTSAGPLAPKWTPSPAEIAVFNRYYDAVEKPMGIMKQAAHGSLTPEAVEAVASVYPTLYAQMQNQVLDQITSAKNDLPYRARQMTSLLLGQDLDGTNSPAAVQATQKIFNPPPPPAPVPAQAVAKAPKKAGVRRPSMAKLAASKNNVASRSMTEVQRHSYDRNS
jgi:hypothetical protein